MLRLRHSVASSKLHDHVNGGASSDVVLLNLHLVCKLLTTKNQLNHFNVHSFFLLKHLFNL